jgi:hypothetical protein
MQTLWAWAGATVVNDTAPTTVKTLRIAEAFMGVFMAAFSLINLSAY